MNPVAATSAEAAMTSRTLVFIVAARSGRMAGQPITGSTFSLLTARPCPRTLFRKRSTGGSGGELMCPARSADSQPRKVFPVKRFVSAVVVCSAAIAVGMFSTLSGQTLATPTTQGCFNDTSQADFQANAGAVNCDLTTNPG